jgi:predicted GIY-YIG superfamily endonuclease
VPDRGTAQRLEAQLKRLSKIEKERLVSGVELTIGSGEQRDGK